MVNSSIGDLLWSMIVANRWNWKHLGDHRHHFSRMSWTMCLWDNADQTQIDCFLPPKFGVQHPKTDSNRTIPSRKNTLQARLGDPTVFQSTTLCSRSENNTLGSFWSDFAFHEEFSYSDGFGESEPIPTVKGNVENHSRSGRTHLWSYSISKTRLGAEIQIKCARTYQCTVLRRFRLSLSSLNNFWIL